MRFWKKPDVGPLEGAEARKRAEQELDRTVAETPLYRALGESLKEVRERNGFAEAIRLAMGAREP